MAGFFHREQQSSFLRSSFDPGSGILFSRREASSYEEPRSDGYDEYFDPPLQSKYVCPICLLGLREPVQTSCGHRFCKGCILRSIRDAGPKCPVDNERLNESQLYPDNFAKREMLSNEVFCRLKKQHGCPWKGPLNKLEVHLEECSFANISCPKECGKQLKKKDLKQHLEECPNRTVPCNFCKEEVKWNELENHYQGCPKYPQACEKCEKENIPKDMMENHLNKECPNTEIKCPFNIVGCSFKGLRAAVTKHVNEQLTSHMMDMSKAIADLIPAQGTETQTQRNPQRRTRGGMEARPQEKASQDVYMTELSALTYQQRGEIDDLRHMVTGTTLSDMVQHLVRRLEKARMGQERPQRRTWGMTYQRCGKIDNLQHMTVQHLERWQEARMRQERPIQELSPRDAGPMCPVDNERLYESQGLRAAFTSHVNEQLTSHMDLSKPIADLLPAQGTETQTQRNPQRRTRRGMEARPQEQAAQDDYMGELSAQTHQQRDEIDDLRYMLTTPSNTVQHLERRLEEARMRQERPQRRTRGGMEARPQEQAAQDVYMGELSAQNYQQPDEIDDLRYMLTTLSNTVQHLERRLEEARMRQERPQRRTRGGMEARPQEQAAQDVFMGELSAQTYQRGEIDDLRHMVTTLFNTVLHLERQQEEARMREARMREARMREE